MTGAAVHGRSAAGGPSAPGRWRRTRLLADLRIADLLTALGTSLSVTAARRIVLAAGAAGALSAFAAGLLAARVLGTLAPGLPSAELFVLLCACAGAGLLAAETLGRFRSTVSGHPQRDFFRALDVPPTAVFMVHVLPRLTAATASWWLAGLGVLLGSGGGTGAAAAVGVLVLPVAVGTCTAAAALWAAAHPERARRRLPAVAAAVALLTGGAAFAAVRLLEDVLGSTRALGSEGLLGSAGALGAEELPGTPGPAVAAVVLALAGAAGAVAGWRALGSRPWSPPSRPAGVRRVRLQGPAALRFARVLSAQRAGGWRLRAQQRVVLAATAVTAAAVSAGAAGPPLPAPLVLPARPAVPEEVWNASAGPATGFVALAVGLALAELVGADIGFLRYGRQLRTAVESGAPAASVALGHAAALSAPVLPVAVLVAVAAGTVTGTASAVPALVVLSGVWAATIAEHLLPPPRTAEGTGGESPLTALLTVALAAVPVVLPMSLPATAAWWAPLSALVLAGGALACLHRALTRR
ncbi:hypothetical protein GCM10011374_14830 [Kocuria dechangensis]|uniref:Uncharacterized protein n=1 Tax=Kocuria dechangensis TaxID=1176249 RepID=A0A917LRZ2_9MICC|nr:hypothetical protein [Kocuria dechangensis]GGG53024.1 hypothetical protein GCM10011374_14830 [Kocuria dechangensis]